MPCCNGKAKQPRKRSISGDDDEEARRKTQIIIDKTDELQTEGATSNAQLLDDAMIFGGDPS